MKEYGVESLAAQGRAYHVKLRGINTLAQADSLAGAEVFISEEDLALLDEEEFYIHELTGCSVLDPEGNKIGVVVDIISVPDNNLLVIDAGGKELLVPFHRSICKRVNVRERQIEIDPPEGLLELNEI